MPATVHVVARFRAREGKEDALKSVLTALIAPSRRELGCYQYDLLQNSSDARDFCFVQRWGSTAAAEQHAATPHVKRASEQMTDLVDGPLEIGRYLQV